MSAFAQAGESKAEQLARPVRLGAVDLGDPVLLGQLDAAATMASRSSGMGSSTWRTAKIWFR
jgi:hypothetical protein